MAVTSIPLELPGVSPTVSLSYKSAVLTTAFEQMGSLKNSMTTEERLHYERRERHHLRRKISPNQYHHIPCSAALDFARTTTPEPLIPEKVHKLAHPAIEHFTGKSSYNIHPYLSLDSKSKTYSGGVVEASRGSGDRIFRRKIAQRSLEISRYAQLSSPPTHNYPFNTPGYIHRAPPHRQIAPPPVNDRPDWTEQDECLDPQPRSILSKVGPMLRKPESIWSVRHGTSKHIERVTTHEDSVLDMSKGGRLGYPWSCACFV